MTQATVFLLVGGIIVIGFIGSLFFERTRIPDLLMLIIIGLILGPGLHLVDPKLLEPVSPVVGAFALMIILFEGGLDLDFDRILTYFAPAFLLAATAFGLTAAGIACLAHYVVGLGWVESWTLGTILGCTSGAIVIPLVGRMKVSEEAKTILGLESALSDVLGAIGTLVFLRLALLKSVELSDAFNALAGAFSIAIVVAVIGGLLWLKVLERLQGHAFSYMLTLAAMLLLYGIVEFVHGSGPMAALTFGIVLSNADTFLAFFGLGKRFVLDEKIKGFHAEMSFFVRTFFFVYLGLITVVGTFPEGFISAVAVFTLLVLLGRYVAVTVVALAYPKQRPNRWVFCLMMPRGLTSAVLAQLPIATGMVGSGWFVEYACAVIILTNLILTFGVGFVERATAALPSKKPA